MKLNNYLLTEKTFRHFIAYKVLIVKFYELIVT